MQVDCLPGRAAHAHPSIDSGQATRDDWLNAYTRNLPATAGRADDLPGDSQAHAIDTALHVSKALPPRVLKGLVKFEERSRIPSMPLALSCVRAETGIKVAPCEKLSTSTTSHWVRCALRSTANSILLCAGHHIVCPVRGSVDLRMQMSARYLKLPYMAAGWWILVARDRRRKEHLGC